MIKNLVKKLIQNNFLFLIISGIYSLPSNILMKGRRRNSLKLRYSFLKKTQIKINGRNNSIRIHPKARFNNCLIYILGNNCKIEIGEKCILSNLELWIEDDGGIITIGAYSTFEGGHFACTEGQSISIGNDCMFSSGIILRNGDSHAIINSETNNRINHAKSINIGNHVWMGADSKVLKGTIIGDNSIIATGAIASGNYSLNNSIYGGVPAKKLRDGIDWKRERSL
jgi:acetyltransferase-like isoleucine patch superfamily enzyme